MEYQASVCDNNVVKNICSVLEHNLLFIKYDAYVSDNKLLKSKCLVREYMPPLDQSWSNFDIGNCIEVNNDFLNSTKVNLFKYYPILDSEKCMGKLENYCAMAVGNKGFHVMMILVIIVYIVIVLQSSLCAHISHLQWLTERVLYKIITKGISPLP